MFNYKDVSGFSGTNSKCMEEEMNSVIRITILVENSACRRDVAAEHGLSFHIQSDKHNIVFDTGQSLLVMDNAKKLGIDQ